MSERPFEKLERTAAVVVGVETYEGNDPLEGAADDARAFAAWLVRCGVAWQKVLLFLSEATDALKVTRVEFDDGHPPVEIPVRPATLQEIYRAFSSEVYGWGQSGDVGLLIVFWAGHGFVKGKERWRMLELADVDPKARVALNFSSLLHWMASFPYPVLQAAFIDACANHVKESGEITFPDNGIFGDHKQFVLHSQRDGRTTWNRRIGDPLSFRGRLLQELEQAWKRERNVETCWPPDLREVASNIKAFFKQKEKDGETDQCPVFDIVGWDGERDDRDPRFGASGKAANPSAARNVPSKHITALAEALGSLAFFNDPKNRRHFLGRLPDSLRGDTLSIDRDFLQQLAENILTDPPDLGRLLEAVDAFPAIRDDPHLDDTVFATLDEVKLLPVRWAQVARLRRLIAGAFRIDGGAAERVLDYCAGREARLRGSPEIGVSHSKGLGALVLCLAGFTDESANRPALLNLANDMAARFADLREVMEAWVQVIVAERDETTLLGPAAGPLSDLIASGRRFVEEHLQMVRADSAQPKPPREVPPVPAEALPCLRMMVDLEPLDFGEADRFEVRIWLQRGDDDLGASDTPAENRLKVADIAALIDRMLRDQKGPGEVELLLPTSMLAEGAGRWRVPFGPSGKVPLDARYPVKLRARERVFGPADGSEPDPGMTEAWMSRFKKLPGPGAGLAENHLVRLCRPEDYLGALKGAHAGAGPVCLAASLAPPDHAGSSSQTLDALLAAGTPIAIWPAPGVAERADPCAALSRLQVVVTGRPPEELPDLVCGLRQNADRVSDPLRHLCLLWDDPEHLPPGVDEILVSLGYA